MTSFVTIATDVAARRHDLLALAVSRTLLLRCHRIALVSGMFPGETQARVVRLDRELREIYDNLASLQSA